MHARLLSPCVVLLCGMTLALDYPRGDINRDGVGARFYGTEGTLVVADDELYVVKERGPEPVAKSDTWRRTYEGQAHIANWLACIRAREEPNAPVELGNQAVNAAHAANLAYRQGTRVKWNAEAQTPAS